MTLGDDLERIAAIAEQSAGPGEELVGILAADAGRRVYLCAYETRGEQRAWLAFDDAGEPLDSRREVREAVSIAALCEIAADTAGGGDLSELRSQLVTLRLTENPDGIDEAEEAALELERTVGSGPRLATAAYLDEIGTATVRLERALGQDGPSPFANAMKLATGAADDLAAEVESSYKRPLT